MGAICVVILIVKKLTNLVTVVVNVIMINKFYRY